MLCVFMPDRYCRMRFSAPTWCRLGLAIYDANLFTVYAMSGLVAFAMNWSSPKSLANELLQFPTFPSGFGTSRTFGSSGITTGFAHLSPSFFKMDSIYLLWDMKMEALSIVILMPTILDGSPRSITSHLAFISAFILFISLIVIANRRRSLTQTVMITKSSLRCQMYAHRSECRQAYPRFLSFVSSSMFHSRLACFRPYNVFMSRHTQPVPSANPSGWCM